MGRDPAPPAGRDADVEEIEAARLEECLEEFGGIRLSPKGIGCTIPPFTPLLCKEDDDKDSLDEDGSPEEEEEAEEELEVELSRPPPKAPCSTAESKFCAILMGDVEKIGSWCREDATGAMPSPCIDCGGRL